MFVFQPSSLHISKDVLYDSNNLVLNLLYQIPTTSFQGCQWVVGFGCYCIVGDSLTHNSQDTIFMLGTIGFVVNIVKDKHKVPDILPQCSDVLIFFVFIKLCNFSLDDDLTPLPSLIKSLIAISRSTTSLSLELSNLAGSI
jgi:hypothetical protein